jgi:ankyrin repeat protein
MVMQRQWRDSSAASLLRAAKAGDIDAVKRNLRGHTGINSQDEDGRTALYYAAWKGHNEVVSLLVESHADINLPDQDGPGGRSSHQ